MIVVTVGTQLPFPRLIKILDELAPELNESIIAQVGNCSYVAQNIQVETSFSPTQFNVLLRDARVIVAHAGIGSVLSARRAGKPIILFPRLAKHGEHRNDHQLATVQQLAGRRGIYSASNKSEVSNLLRKGDLAAPDGSTSKSLEALRLAVRSFIL